MSSTIPEPERRSPLTPTAPPPVYTAAAPTVPFVVVEDAPPPYSPKQDRSAAPARRGLGRDLKEGRVCGIKTVNLVAVLAVLLVAAVVSGGVYGFQNRSSSDGGSDENTVVVDPGQSVTGPGMDTGLVGER